MSEASNDDVTRVIAQSGETTSGGEEGTASPLVSRGEAVGRYIIIDEIGRGGMGVVYAAYDPELDRKVALKLLRPKAASRDGLPRARERLAREAQAMAKLSHDNVVRVFDVGTHGDRVFVALEFIDGETLGRWLARERRSWQEVLPLFVQAGRGLAAAHAEGLIHRDFKPENVMLDRRGHVSVMDFGLARPAGNTLSSPDMPHDSVDSSAEIDLTATGFVIGTPAYMSPEQIAHAAIDPRADQFSFCVALFEGLYGRRPFAGKTMAELQKAIARSDPSERTDASAPGWLRRAVLRGLSPKAPDRWPSMNALLDVLDQPVDGARRHWVMGATVVGAATLGAVGYGLVEEAPGDPCGAADAALDDVWTEARRRAAASAFQSTSLPYAADAWERADGVLKSYASEWTAQRRDACEANKVRGDESAALFDRRIACLEGRKAALSSQLNVFEEADATVVERAYAAASSLPDLGWCGNASALLADVAPPDDHDVARRVDAVRERLAGVDALRNAGLVKRADETVESVLEAAVQTGYAPVRIEVVLGLAHTRFKAGRIEDAEAAARDALVLAEELGMDDVGAQAHRLLIEVLTKTAEHDEALMLSRVALAKLERLGAPAQRRADLYRTRALLYDARGEYDAAREDHERWVAMLDEGDSDPFRRAQAAAGAGRMSFRARDFAAAKARFTEAAEAAQSSLGPRHPEVARMLGNAATASQAGGDLEEAERLQTKVLSLLEDALGPDHPDLALATTNLGSVKRQLGQLEDALALQRRSVAIRVNAYGPDHAQVGRSKTNEAVVLSKMKRYDEALEVSLDAVRILEKGYGAEHPYLIDPLLGLGETYADLGRHTEAVTALRRSLALSLAAKEPGFRLAPIQLQLARAIDASQGAEGREEALALARAAETGFAERDDPSGSQARALVESLSGR